MGLAVSSLRQVALAFVAAFATGDPEAVLSHVADGFVNDHTSALGRGTIGKEAYRDALPGFLAAFPGLRYDVEDLVVEGDQAAVFYVMTADGIELRGVFHLWVEGGLVVRRVDYWDSLTYLRQTGQA